MAYREKRDNDDDNTPLKMVKSSGFVNKHKNSEDVDGEEIEDSRSAYNSNPFSSPSVDLLIKRLNILSIASPKTDKTKLRKNLFIKSKKNVSKLQLDEPEKTYADKLKYFSEDFLSITSDKSKGEKDDAGADQDEVEVGHEDKDVKEVQDEDEGSAERKYEDKVLNEVKDDDEGATERKDEAKVVNEVKDKSKGTNEDEDRAKYESLLELLNSIHAERRQLIDQHKHIKDESKLENSIAKIMDDLSNSDKSTLKSNLKNVSKVCFILILSNMINQINKESQDEDQLKLKKPSERDVLAEAFKDYLSNSVNQDQMKVIEDNFIKAYEEEKSQLLNLNCDTDDETIQNVLERSDMIILSSSDDSIEILSEYINQTVELSDGTFEKSPVVQSGDETFYYDAMDKTYTEEKTIETSK